VQFHHFVLGQVVRLLARDGDAPAKVAKYKVTRLLPSDGVRCRYCIEHEELLFSRLAWERPDWRHPPGMAN
jgi:hypothetical protein